MPKHLVVYTRTFNCPYWERAKAFLDAHGIPYEMLYIDQDAQAKQKVLTWTGMEIVPTLVIAAEGSRDPFFPPAPLADDQSPHGVDRGTMFSEPSDRRLEIFLRRNGIMK